MGLHKISFAVVFVLLMLPGAVPAVAANSGNFATWSLIKVDYRMTHKLGFVGYAEFRSKENLKHTDRWTLSAMLNYRLNSYLKVEGGYAFHYRYKGEGVWGVRNRYKLGLTGTLGWSNIKLSLRERLQRTTADGVSEDRLRSRLKLSYSSGKSVLSPYFSAELFQPLGDDAFFTVSRMRYRPGIVFKLSRVCSLDLFYCRQYEPKECRNIMGVELGLKF